MPKMSQGAGDAVGGSAALVTVGVKGRSRREIELTLLRGDRTQYAIAELLRVIKIDIIISTT